MQPIAEAPNGGLIVGVVTEAAQSWLFWAIIANIIIMLSKSVISTWFSSEAKEKAQADKERQEMREDMKDIKDGHQAILNEIIRLGAVMPDGAKIKEELRSEFRFMLEKISQQSRGRN